MTHLARKVGTSAAAGAAGRRAAGKRRHAGYPTLGHHPTSAAYDRNPTLAPGATVVVSSPSSTSPSVSVSEVITPAPSCACLIASIAPSAARSSLTRTYSRRPLRFL